MNEIIKEIEIEERSIAASVGNDNSLDRGSSIHENNSRGISGFGETSNG